MLALRTSRRCLLKLHSGLGINRSYNSATRKTFSVIRPCTTATSNGSSRFFMHSAVKYVGQPPDSDQDHTAKIGELTEFQAYDMIHKLSDNDRKSLSNALSRYDSEKTKSKFQGKFHIIFFFNLIKRNSINFVVVKLAASNWRSKFGRRSGEQLGSVDPTGS